MTGVGKGFAETVKIEDVRRLNSTVNNMVEGEEQGDCYNSPWNYTPSSAVADA